MEALLANVQLSVLQVFHGMWWEKHADFVNLDETSSSLFDLIEINL